MNMISILKITKGNSAKRISILTIYKITKGHKTAKNIEGVKLIIKSGHIFICTKFREIISNDIKVIERNDFYARN